MSEDCENDEDGEKKQAYISTEFSNGMSGIKLTVQGRESEPLSDVSQVFDEKLEMLMDKNSELDK